MDKKWVIERGDVIDKRLALNPVIQRIMNARGVSSFEEASEFISMKPQVTHNPFLMKDMEEAVELILSGADMGKKICVYGDYDTDGVTSVSLLVEILKYISDNVMYYLPSRFEEGYGLNISAVDKIYDMGADIIVTVDCGSVSVNEVSYAKSLGIEIIVSDHHALSDEKPPCPVINPKQEDCTYPFKELCGCGVAFKIAQAIQRKAGLPKTVLVNCLDLVAIATIGDIVPLCGENRTLIKYGLPVIREGRRKGLAEMIERTGINLGEINSEQLAYLVVPHINAAGRMDDAGFCVELLLSTDMDKINEYVDKLIEKNTLRKKIQEETFDRCCEIVEHKHLNDRFLLIYADDAHEGVTGIVAGKLKEKYSRPAAIVTRGKEGIFKGTARSIENINIHMLLKKYERLFEKFGGHAGACGFSIKEDNIDELRNGLNESLNNEIKDDSGMFMRVIKIDGEVSPKDFNLKFCDDIDKLEPLGYQNEKPVFLVRNGYILNYNYIGEEAKHVRFSLDFPGLTSVNCILFQRAGEYEGIIHKGIRVDVVGYIEKNKFNGNVNIQIKVIDIKRAGEFTKERVE